MQLPLVLEKPLEYEIVVSGRARRASLRVEPGRGLVVTVPKAFAEHEISAFVELNRTWVEDRLAAMERDTPARYRCWPPRELDLKGSGKLIRLDYACMSEPAFDNRGCDFAAPADKPEQNWLVNADPSDRATVVAELSVRLKSLARELLIPWVASLSHLHRLNYRRVSIRGQKSRWGSCSSSGTLSLNYKLLFIDRSLVNYVLLHELAHTVHLNHSPQFWEFLQSLDVNARSLDRQLRNAGRLVPPWLAANER